MSYSLKANSSGGAEPLIRATRAVGSIRISCIGVSWVELRERSIRNRDIAIHDIPTGTRIVWSHNGVGEWTGGTPYRGFVARSPETFALGFTIPRTPKCRWSEAASE
jgi:hypothetical protein